MNEWCKHWSGSARAWGSKVNSISSSEMKSASSNSSASAASWGEVAWNMEDGNEEEEEDMEKDGEEEEDNLAMADTEVKINFLISSGHIPVSSCTRA